MIKDQVSHPNAVHRNSYISSMKDHLDPCRSRLIIALAWSLPLSVLAQPTNDDCSGAIFLTPTSVWSPVVGDVAGATQSAPGSGCSSLGAGASNDDVWFAFVATQPSHVIRVESSPGFFAVVDSYVGACSDLVAWECRSFSSTVTTLVMSGLTVGETAFVRVYDMDDDVPSSTTFEISVMSVANGPVNNNCGGAIQLFPAPSCTSTTGNTMNATESMSFGSCNGSSGDSNDDVWFKFTATSTEHTARVQGSSGFRPCLDILSGDCFSMTQLVCQNTTAPGGVTNTTVLNLVIGTTYWVRVFDYLGYDPETFTFSLCILGPAPQGACDGGSVVSDQEDGVITICKDGVADLVQFSHMSTSNANSSLVLTDEFGVFITLLSPGGIDLDVLAIGNYQVHAASYDGNLTNLIPGIPVGSIGSTGDCFELSVEALDVFIENCTGMAILEEASWVVRTLPTGHWEFQRRHGQYDGAFTMVLFDARGRVVTQEERATADGLVVAMPGNGLFLAQVTTTWGSVARFRLVGVQ